MNKLLISNNNGSENCGAQAQRSDTRTLHSLINMLVCIVANIIAAFIV